MPSIAAPPPATGSTVRSTASPENARAHKRSLRLFRLRETPESPCAVCLPAFPIPPVLLSVPHKLARPCRLLSAIASGRIIQCVSNSRHARYTLPQSRSQRGHMPEEQPPLLD